MRINKKGQVTIPAHLRKASGLLPDVEVELVLDGDSVRIVKRATEKRQGKAKARAAEIVRRLEWSGDVAMTTDAIMSLTRDIQPETS